MGQALVERALRTGKLPKLSNLIIPRLIREGLSCLSPSSGRHWLSLTQLYRKQTTMYFIIREYNDSLRRESFLSNASATKVNILFRCSEGKKNTELKLNLIMQWQSKRTVGIESGDYSLLNSH